MLNLGKRQKNVVNGLLRLFLIAVTVVLLYPLFWNIYSSFKTSTEFLGDPFALPASLQWDNYIRAMEKTNIGSNFKNSLYVVVLSLLLISFSRHPLLVLPGKISLHWAKVDAEFIHVIDFYSSALYPDSSVYTVERVGMAKQTHSVEFAVRNGQIPFSVFLLSGFMKGIPRDYEEAAMIDGCGYFRILPRIIVPIAKPGIVTVLMLSAMGIWNEYVLALVLLTDPAKQTVPVGVAVLYEVQRYATDWGALFAALVIVLIPSAVGYAFWTKILD